MNDHNGTMYIVCFRDSRLPIKVIALLTSHQIIMEWSLGHTIIIFSIRHFTKSVIVSLLTQAQVSTDFKEHDLDCNQRSFLLEISHVSFLTLTISFSRSRTCHVFTLAMFLSYDSMICCAHLISLCHWDTWLSNVTYDRSQGLGQRDSTHTSRPYLAQVGSAANLYVYTNHTNPLNLFRFQHLASFIKTIPNHRMYWRSSS